MTGDTKRCAAFLVAQGADRNLIPPFHGPKHQRIMKKIIAYLLLTAGLALSTQAATTAGFEAGYLTDGQDAYIAARLGYEFKATTSVSHQAEIELGYSESTESGVKFKILPLTLNYRAEFAATGKLSYYAGAGIGICRNSLSYSGYSYTSSDSNNALVLQAFSGVNYKASPSATLHLGLKYIWIGETELLGIKANVGDDVAIMAGVSFKF